VVRTKETRRDGRARLVSTRIQNTAIVREPDRRVKTLARHKKARSEPGTVHVQGCMAGCAAAERASSLSHGAPAAYFR
jgi:hypothetical protein